MSIPSVRNKIFETVRYGAESVAGSAVTVTDALSSISINASSKTAISKFRPNGSKVYTVAALGREWTEFSWESPVPSYEEIGLIFDSLIAKNEGGVTTMLTTSPNTPQTYTFEVGTGANCVKFASAIFAEGSMRISSDEITLSGSGFGQKATSTTASTGATLSEVTPIQAGQVVISCDGTDLKLDDGTVFNVELNFGRNWEMVKGIDNEGTGFKKISELGPEMTFSMTLEGDANGTDFLDVLRDDNAVRLFEIEATDGTNTLLIQFGGIVTETQDYGEVDGVTTVGYVFSITTQESLGAPIKVTVS